MYQLFLNWLGDVGSIDHDILVAFAAIASLAILDFLLDFFRLLMYLCSKR